MAAVRRSRALHRGWVTPPSTPDTFRRYLERLAGDEHRGFLVININNIIRGAFGSAFLGYYAFADWSGRGYLRQGMQLVLRQAFGKLRLHRVEANIQPGNKASLALVQACGFVREGYSQRYLKVAGRWRDHERWALLAGEFKKGQGRSKADP
jgi:[ribosomal protein S5]-alanine N-acetyltransferase